MKQDKIGVFVRVRPYQDKQSPSTFILSLTEKEISVKDKQRDKEQDLNFGFDHIFQVKSTQAEVFEKIGKPIVDSAFEGINGTIFAYGQTSSGKTYTCVGPDCEDINDKGLLPRSVSSIFQRIGESPNFIQFRIKVSMVEIYMEKIRDLLQPSKNDLKIRENKSKGVYIQDVTEQYVSSAQEAMKIFKKGVSNRVVAFTSMNDVSSRSHMAFILTLHQSNLKDGSAKSAKMTVIDLAGSEKVSKTHAQGKVLDQAKQINKSLSALGNVINALTDPKFNHIPYRDSKLTRLLQQSIGGNSKTSLIINISPSSINASQSISSLRFGYRAKQIKNKPKVNKEYTISQLLLLLQNSQKRNQELQLLLKQLSLSNNKKIKQKQKSYVENLLDSDNPIMSAIEDNDFQSQKPNNRSAAKTIKKYYQSEIGSDDQQGVPKLSSRLSYNSNQQKLALTTEQVQKLRMQLQQKQQQLLIIGEQLQRVNNQRIENGRELQICKQRLELIVKEAKLNLMKLNAQKRQNQQMLQKYIKEQLEKQQKQSQLQSAQERLINYEEKFIKLSQIQEDQIKKSKVFGLEKTYNEQTSKIISEVLRNIDESDPALKAAEQSAKIQRQNSDLKAKIKQVQQEMKIYENLEKVKEDLIKQKLNFMAERDRVYKDLQNRIQKVLELQQKLDEERQINKNLNEILNLQEGEKSRKIISLQKHIHQMSQNYFVLKGQQSSWSKNNSKLQEKITQLAKKVLRLQSENMDLRAQIQNLQMKCDQLQSFNDNQSMLEVQIEDEESERGKGNIVKVVRSDIFGNH